MAAISGRRTGTPIAVGTKAGQPRRAEDVRARPVTDATRDDAWRAIVHASRDLPEDERVKWARDMRQILGLADDDDSRKSGRCGRCGDELPMPNGSNQLVRSLGLCTLCLREEGT
jgi:hypothetical protein